MFGSEILDVAIGIVLLFLFMSLAATAAQEALEGLLKLRSADLERGIRELLDEPKRRTVLWQRTVNSVQSIANGLRSIARRLGRGGREPDATPSLIRTFYEHPFIYALYPGTYRPAARGLPSYIPAASFAGALLDIVTRGAPGASGGLQAKAAPTLETLRANIAALPSERLQRAVLAAIDQAGADLASVKAQLESYFDATMDRVSGWYKRRIQLVLFLVGLATAAAFNVDPVAIAGRLSTDKALRAAAVARAEQLTQDDETSLPASVRDKSLDDLRKQIVQIGFPIGWTSDGASASSEQGAADPSRPLVARSDGIFAERLAWFPHPQACQRGEFGRDACTVTYGVWAQAVFGWLITALATMLGAPFWFDLLNKVMVIRATVKPREKSQDEGSEDRQNTSAETARAGTGSSTRSKTAVSAPTSTASSLPTLPTVVFTPHAWANDANAQEGLL